MLLLRASSKAYAFSSDKEGRGPTQLLIDEYSDASLPNSSEENGAGLLKAADSRAWS